MKKHGRNRNLKGQPNEIWFSFLDQKIIWNENISLATKQRNKQAEKLNEVSTHIFFVIIKFCISYKCTGIL